MLPLLDRIQPIDTSLTWIQRVQRNYVGYDANSITAYHNNLGHLLERRNKWFQDKILSRMQCGVATTTKHELGYLSDEEYYFFFGNETGQICCRDKKLKRRNEIIKTACITHSLKKEHHNHPWFVTQEIVKESYFSGTKETYTRTERYWVVDMKFRYYPKLNWASIFQYRSQEIMIPTQCMTL